MLREIMLKVGSTVIRLLQRRADSSVQTPAPSPVPGSQPATSTPTEFSETTSVCLEWRLNGLKAMYDSTKGEAKS